MNEDAKTALLAQWRAEVETYKGCPTDAELLDLMSRTLALQDEPGCICRSKAFNLTVNGAPFMTLCACQLEGLRQFARSRQSR